jgi:hypothetical protein
VKIPTQISWIAIVLCLVFVVTLTLIGNEVAVRLENYVGVALAIACLVQYRQEAIDALIKPRPTNFQVFALGMAMVMLASIIRNFYSSIERDFDIGWVRWGPLVPVFLFLMIMGAVFKIIAPHVEDGRADWPTLRHVIWIGMCGVAAALAVTGYLYFKANGFGAFA